MKWRVVVVVVVVVHGVSAHHADNYSQQYGYKHMLLSGPRPAVRFLFYCNCVTTTLKIITVHHNS